MNTSPATTTLSKPAGDEEIPSGTFGYFQARNKYRAYSLVLDEFKRSGISQATLARRLGKTSDIVNRWLGGPGNWTLDTLSDLLFAISGAATVFGKEFPLDKPPRNKVGPDWIQAAPVFRIEQPQPTASSSAADSITIDFHNS